MTEKAMNPIPEGVNTVTPYLLFYGECSKALELYPKAFDAKLVGETDKAPDGKIMHAMMKIGDSNIMLSDTFNPDSKSLPGHRMNLWMYVADSDALFEKATSAGCTVTMPIEDAFWGDRVGQVMDPFGHTWSIASRKLMLTPDEIKERESQWIESRKETAAAR